MNILVFDTETVGVITQDLLNVGYKVIDINPATGEYATLVKRDYIVIDLYNNTPLMLNDMFVGAEKYGKYTALLESKQIIKHSIEKIFDIMRNDLAKYKPLFAYAYNCVFDTDKFEKTADKYKIENPLNGLTVHDIWAYAVQYICRTDEYIAWAKANEIFTESGCYIKTSVESVVKYLTKNLDFVENHTALDDCGWETEILVECIKRGCDITKPMKKGGNIPSEKVFTKKMVLPSGEEIEIAYTKEYERNGMVKYKA